MTFLSFGKWKPNNPLSYKKPQSYIDEVKEFVKEWNDTFPFDRHFREEYKIPIFSETHLDTSFFTMLCWWQEWELYNKKEEKTNEEQAIEFGENLQKIQQEALSKRAGL